MGISQSIKIIVIFSLEYRRDWFETNGPGSKTRP